MPSVDLAVYFASQTTHVRGQGVFTGRLPDSPSVAIVFSDTGGFGPTNVFGTTAFRQPSLQVVTRATALDYNKARALIDEVFTVLHCKANITANGNFYKAIDAIQEPMWLGYDESERPMWAINFQIMF